METLSVAIVTLVGGAVIGYLVRLTEFRRDRRLKAYENFVAAFIAAGHAGAALYSLYTSLGDKLWQMEHRQQVEPLWTAWADAAESLETAAARLNLVGSDSARTKAVELDDFITANIRRVPPLYRTRSTEEWGDAAKVGPRRVDEDTVRLAREFADTARDEITRWKPRARRTATQ